MSGIAKAAAGAILLSMAIGLQSATGQVPGPQAAPARAAAISPAEIEALVAPVALYPDDILAVVLRAAIQPVQIVQAVRFLDKAAKDGNLKPNPGWTEPVRVMLNYPDALRKMNDDLDWTERLGEAVQTQQADVLAAIQQFRRKVAAAGKLRSDDKQTVTQDGNVYVIMPANPKVVYIPVYDPAAAVVPQPAPPPPVYVPTPYPVYYETYPAGAAATGFFFGAATTAWAMNWRNYDIDEDDVREFQQSRQQAAKDMQQSGQSAAAQRQQTRQDSTAQRQQTRQEAAQGRQPAAQPLGAGQGQQDLRAVLGGDRPAQMPAAAGSGARPGLQPQGGINWGGGERPGYQPQRQSGQGFEQRRGQSPDAFSYGSGRDAFQASDRGAQSRNFGGGGGRQFQGGGGRRR